ncbi:hypothetical protein [Blautia sp. 1033sp1_1033st1_G9_1033SCRN_220408]|uniref:PcsB-like coiled-coil domain-containing protein n=1 Tax=Blautia sp. 1033sp1_1033st1_G9_1033SCRN_220408 TaxID=3144490 RepID=UPI0034A4C552
MRNKKLIPVLLAGILTLTTGTGVYAADIDEQIADMQSQKAQAQAGLAQAQGNISSLESKRQELESYLAQLNSQYEELTDSVSQLSIQAAQKEDELQNMKLELAKAQQQSQQQYEAMKKRIVYMYENGGTTMLELLLSSSDLTQFMNRAENISQLSKYDRDMLKKYEDLQASIQEQEENLEKEAASVNQLLAESASKKQEVQALVSSTNDSIASYISQISVSQAEAAALSAQISSAENSIYSLTQQAAAQQETAQQEEAQQEGAQQEEAQQEETQQTEDQQSQSQEEDTYTESSSSGSGDSYNDESGSVESSGSGQGTYLGNFTLTAYCNCAQCCGTAGNLTASGTVPSAGRTVAMAGVPFGTQLLINGNVYTVEDLGTPYGHVDIFFGSHSEALSFGLQHADVYQLN